MAKKDKRLWIDMCAGSELKDTQGETLSIEGANIEDLEQGRGRLNDNHGKGFFNSIGRVTEAKKILKAEDCENDRQKYYWEKIKAPYVYAKGFLYNDEDHSNAKAAAAILRNIHREDSPLAMKASVEGGVVSRGIKDPTRLARTKIHSVALTFTPANNATLVEPLNIDKSNTDWEADKRLIESVKHLAKTNIPSFRHIERHASAHEIHENLTKIQELAKSLGIEMEIKESTPEEIIKHAVFSKIGNNVNKINQLVKAMSASDEQEIGMLRGYKRDYGVSRAKDWKTGLPKDASRTLGSKQYKIKNTIQTHAMRAHHDPSHLNRLHRELTNRGIHPNKVGKILEHIKSNMPNPMAKRAKLKESIIQKALTAGYGGAGTPTNLTGGGAIQPESLEGSKKSETFTYITCDHCGKEQVHMKHQVKCRDCGKNFSLEKLENHI